MDKLAQQAVADQINAYYGNMPAQPAQYQSYQQPVTAQSYQQPQQNNPELWYTDPAKAEENLKLQMANAVQSYIQQQAAPLVSNNIETAKALSRQDPANKVAWDRYGNEIESLLQSPQISANYKASKAVWDQAAELVKARHLDELVDERAKEVAAAMGVATETPVGQSPQMNQGQQSAMDKIRNSDYGKDLISKYGERGVLDVCDKAGWTLDQYATMVENTHVTRDPDKPGEWTNSSLARGV